MDFTTWLAFFGSAWLIALSPGSGAVLSMSHGLAYGFKHSSATVLGLQAGLLLIFAIAGAGVGSVLLASNLAFNIIKIVGALYLIYIGISQWLAKIVIDPTIQTAAITAPHWRSRFLSGFITNSTNPKGIVFMVAVLPHFIDGNKPLLMQLLILGTTLCGVDLIVMHGYAFTAATMQSWFRNAQALKIQNRFFGGVLMLMGVSLFFVKRSANG